MNKFRAAILIPMLILAAGIMYLPPRIAHAYFKATTSGGVVSCADTNNASTFISTPDGVLVTCTQPSLPYYLDGFLNENITYIMFLAFIMVVASGIQYMLSGFSPDGAKKAKERIVGIMVGILFFLSIRLILNQLANNITIPINPGKTAPAQEVNNPSNAHVGPVGPLP